MYTEWLLDTREYPYTVNAAPNQFLFLQNMPSPAFISVFTYFNSLIQSTMLVEYSME